MKVTVKTTQQKVFQIDVEGSDTVGVLKTKIHESQGHPATAQKIIYSGKILTDEKTIESCGIKEKDFLVLMVSKPKPTPSPTPASSSTPVPQPAAPAAPAPAPESTPAAPPPPAPASDAPAAAAPASTPATAAPAFGDTSSFISGGALQDAINNMVEMGFPREQVLRAMRASFNNADRAVEYLMTGIPAHLEAEAAPAPAVPAAQPAAAASAQPAAPTPPAPAAQPGQPQNLFQLAQQQQQSSGGGSGGGGHNAGQQLDLAALRNNPQLQQLRQQFIENPNMVQPLIQQLAAQNPAMANMISQNPEALLQLLGLAGEGDFDGEEGGIPPGAQVISVTEEERAAIQRLEELGFSRQAAVEAYFACDKNEDMAASYLFETNDDA